MSTAERIFVVIAVLAAGAYLRSNCRTRGDCVGRRGLVRFDYPAHQNPQVLAASVFEVDQGPTEVKGFYF